MKIPSKSLITVWVRVVLIFLEKVHHGTACEFFLNCKLKSVSARKTCSTHLKTEGPFWTISSLCCCFFMLFYYIRSCFICQWISARMALLCLKVYYDNRIIYNVGIAILMIVLFSVISLLLNWISALHQSTSHLVKINFRKRKSNRRQCQSVTPFQISWQIQFITLLLQFQL